MVDPSAELNTRSRLDMQAILELLEAQRRRVQSYVELKRPQPRVTPPGPDVSVAALPSAQQMLDALPVPALLLAPVFDTDGAIRDTLYVAQNTPARRYAAERLPRETPKAAERSGVDLRTVPGDRGDTDPRHDRPCRPRRRSPGARDVWVGGLCVRRELLFLRCLVDDFGGARTVQVLP